MKEFERARRGDRERERTFSENFYRKGKEKEMENVGGV